MDNLKNTIKKSIKNILLIIIPILIFLSHKGMAAYNGFDAIMNIPDTGFRSALGGEAPWYIKGGTAERTVTYPNPVHYQAFENDEEQTVYIHSNAVYCCDLYSHVRSGEFDNRTIFIADPSSGDTVYTPRQALEHARELVYNSPDVYIDNNFSAHNFTHSEADIGSDKKLITMDDISAYYEYGATFAMDEYAYVANTSGTFLAYIGKAKMKMEELFKELGEDKKANWFSAGDATSDPISKNMPEIDGKSGPIIVIMEKEETDKYDEDNRGYKKTEEGSFINNAESYVLTAIRGLYRQGQGEYTLAQIQLAWWALVDTGIAGHDRGNPVRAGNNSFSYIKDDALAYEKYRTKYLDKNNKLKSQYYSVNATEAEAIIDQEEQSYTVGPFTLIYPSGDSEDGVSYSFNQFVYVKGLTVRTYDTPDSTTATNTLYYDEISNDFEIKFPVGHSGTTGGSGLTKVYPRSNNKFYVKIYANGGNGFKACGTPEKVEVSFSLEYLTTSEADYEILESYANMYAYIGHVNGSRVFNGIDKNNGMWSTGAYNHDCPLDHIFCDVRWKDATYLIEGYYQYATNEPIYGMYQIAKFRDDYNLGNNADISQYYHDTSHWAWVDNPGKTGIDMSLWIYQPYIKMSEYRYKGKKLLPQKLMKTIDGERKYVTILSSESVTFTMDLGGKVFEDLRRGKKSEVDGYYALHELGSDQAQDYPMQNVIVLLYRHNLNNEKGENVLGETVPGEFIGWTKTDENGEYKFEELNEMYKYHVEFIYNGQYYEPTKYTMYESLNKLTEELTDDLAGQKRKERWEKSSKALESYKERDDFNIKFGEIGASPTNVIPDASKHLQYKSTYREDLEDKEIIDKVFTDNNLRKSAGILLDYDINDQGQLVVTKYNEDYTDFARESLTRAYTYEKYENDQLDLFLYPISEVFVENNVVLSSHRDVMQKSVKALYDNINDDSIDEMHHINLGLVDREEFKVQLLKDVDAVIFEVNDKTYTYYYNTRKLNDQIEADKIGYGLDVRAIDGYAYYREDVTREIYREDYEYDAKDYMYNSFWRRDDNGLMSPMTDEQYDELIAAKETGELEIYVRYRMLVKVNSSLIKTEITEIVDYYDKEFTVIGNEANGNEFDRVTNNNVVTQNEVNKYAPYYGVLNTSEKITDLSNQYSALSENRIDIKTESRYADDKNAKGVVDPQDAFTKNDYNRIYLDTSKVRLDPVNASFTAFVTFRVNKEEVNGERGQHIILDEVKDGSEADYIAASKVNIAEINGYKTYYYKEDRAPNYENTDNKAEGEYKENDVAGVVERYSTPGNLAHISKDLVDDVYDNAGNPHKVLRQAKAVSVEPDADMAPLLHIILNKDEKRTIVGNVWEDERENEGIVSKGDGERDDGEADVNGVIVQLIQVKKDDEGKIIEEYLAKQYKTGKTKNGAITTVKASGASGNAGTSNDTATTGEGQYAFIGIPAGDYIVRFIYGADASTAIGTEAIDYATGTTYSNPVVGFCTNAYNEVTDEHSSIYDQSGPKGNTNIHSYTGNDYKSTKTKGDVEVDLGKYEHGYYENLDLNLLNATKNISYAKDIWSRRQNVNAYSNEDLTNHRAEVLSSFESIPEGYEGTDMNSLLGELYAYTYMVADTDIIDFEVEYNRTGSSYPTNNERTGNDKDGHYNLDGLNFGLERRPRAQLKTTDQVINVRVTLANGNVLFDARDTATNVQWRKHIAHNPDSENTYEDGKNYDMNDLSVSKAQMLIPSVRSNGSNGVINLTMDEELMQGATIEITYAITVANIGEVDYNTLDYYYKGIIPNTDEAKMASIVRTTPKEVISYVGYQPNVGARKNNLSFNKEQNPDWEPFREKDKSDIIKTTSAVHINKVPDLYEKIFYYNFIVDNESSEEKANNARKKFETAALADESVVDQNVVNFDLKDAIGNYDTIIHTTALADKKLIPIIADGSASEDIEDRFANDPINTIDAIRNGDYKSVAGVKLILGRVMSGNTKSPDMVYNNLVEVVKVSNDVGRRMNYSVVGNQNPNPESGTSTPTEIDADIAQEVSILPPFGQTQRYYYLGFGVAAILLVGTLMVMAFTKKKDDDNTVKVTNEGKK